MIERGLLDNACEQFIGRTTDEIRNMLLATLDGHLRAIMGTLIALTVHENIMRGAYQLIALLSL